jgi:hypothetical protein
MYTTYSYNRDVNAFMSYLDSPLTPRSRFSGGMAATAQGLPEYDSEIGFAVYPDDDWILTLSENLSMAITDKTKTWATKFKVSRYVGNHWEFGLGDEYDSSDEDVENLVIADIEYTF